MKITVPDYYKEFKCIAGACEDTCCAGWQVDVDEDSFAYYKFQYKIPLRQLNSFEVYLQFLILKKRQFVLKYQHGKNL